MKNDTNDRCETMNGNSDTTLNDSIDTAIISRELGLLRETHIIITICIRETPLLSTPIKLPTEVGTVRSRVLSDSLVSRRDHRDVEWWALGPEG